MRIHIIRTSEVKDDHYFNTLEIVRSIPGPLKFVSDPDEIEMDDTKINIRPFSWRRVNNKDIHPRASMDADSNRFYSWVPEEPEEVKIVSWKSLFKKCNEFRKHNRIPHDEHVILLTYLVNDLNWFSGSDENGYNHFIHADQWDFFLPCDPKFPVAYEVMACIIRRFMFRNYDEGSQYFHQKPRGCLNDFCKEKKEVTLKLRTGDICPDCMKLIKTKSVPVNVIDQVMKTFDSIRAQMLFRERYRAVQLPSRLTIEGPMHKIYFTDLANAELKLTPLEKTVYLLFLKEKDGLKLNELCDHRDWIKDTYIRIGNANNLAERENSINQLVDTTEPSASEKISKIKRKITQITGEELARHYIIEGENNEKKSIALDRSLVSYV